MEVLPLEVLVGMADTEGAPVVGMADTEGALVVGMAEVATEGDTEGAEESSQSPQGYKNSPSQKTPQMPCIGERTQHSVVIPL